MATLQGPPPPPQKTGNDSIDSYLANLYQWNYRLWFHTTTNGEALGLGSLATQMIEDGAVTTPKVADSNITTAKVADANITTAKVADSNITTAKVADEAITVPVSSFVSAGGTFNGAAQTLTSLTITTDGSPVYLSASCNPQGNFTATRAGGNISIFRGTTDLGINSFNMVTANEAVPMACSGTDSPAAGTYTYYLKITTASQPWTVNSISLFAMCIKK